MQLESYVLQGQKLWLSNERSIYWEEERALIVSDLHFGKTGHFRKAGIAVPQSLYKEDLQRLINHLQYFKPSKIIIVGDLFHSHANKELELFQKWRADFSELEVHLVKGNHDILHRNWYSNAGITVSEPSLSIGNFCFRHDMNDCLNDEGETGYLFSGHLHPGITIHGMGKQSLRFPCFYFTQTYCVLPAFSKFTGAARVDPKPGEVIFAIVENSIIRI